MTGRKEIKDEKKELIEALAIQRWPIKKIARNLKIAIPTVKKYLPDIEENNSSLLPSPIPPLEAEESSQPIETINKKKGDPEMTKEEIQELTNSILLGLRQFEKEKAEIAEKSTLHQEVIDLREQHKKTTEILSKIQPVIEKLKGLPPNTCEQWPELCKLPDQMADLRISLSDIRKKEEEKKKKKPGEEEHTPHPSALAYLDCPECYPSFEKAILHKMEKGEKLELEGKFLDKATDEKLRATLEARGFKITGKEAEEEKESGKQNKKSNPIF